MNRKTMAKHAQILSLAIGLILSLPSAIASAQETTSAPRNEWSEEQALSILAEAAKNDEIKQFAEGITAQMLTTGEIVPDWQDNGVDILAELAALPGGLAGNLLLEHTDEGPIFFDLSGHSMPEITGFHSYHLLPDPFTAQDQQSQKILAQLDLDNWLETTETGRVIGNALCYSGDIGVMLHSTQALREMDREDVEGLLIINTIADYLTKQEVCTIYHHGADGEYIAKNFTPDGHSLPVLNSLRNPAEIFPAKELPGLILEIQHHEPEAVGD